MKKRWMPAVELTITSYDPEGIEVKRAVPFGPVSLEPTSVPFSNSWTVAPETGSPVPET